MNKNSKSANKPELQLVGVKQPSSMYYVPEFNAVVEAVDAKDAAEKAKKGNE